jgi:tetratricopeptide (TPR) repeat protein
MGDSFARRTTDHRLDSWKEIAAFFGRDERTVRRWEKERGLPAHRVPGGARGGVFAYTAELAQWLKGPGSELQVGEPGMAVTEPVVAENAGETKGKEKGIQGASSSRPPEGQTVMAEVVELRPAAASRPSQANPPSGRTVAWLSPLLVVAVLIVALSVSHRATRYRNALAAAHSPNPEAQELYLKGEYHWTKRTPEDLNKAVDYFTQSIVKDPSYAPAYVGLADCYNLLREFSIMPPDEAYPRALAAAQKAVELDDTSAGAHTSLAFATYYWNWDPVTAEREYKRALELNPNLVQGHHWYATFLLTAGRFPEALDQIEQARKLDPASTTIQADKGWILFHAGRASEAFALLKQLESTDPTLATTNVYLTEIYFERKDYTNFFAESKRSAQLRHDEDALAVANAAERGFAAGGLLGMRQAMLPVQKRIFDRGAAPAYGLAATYALLGKNEDALRYLQMAYEKREIGLLYLPFNPDFNSLHDDSEYKKIAEHVRKKLVANPQP